jgi:uncharacterized repeat protein (TIGR02059 family)
VPSATSFNVFKDGVKVTISSVQISEKSVYLTLKTPVSPGEEVTLDYLVPAYNPIQFLDTSKAAGLKGIIVENNLIVIVPEILGAAIESSFPDILNLTFASELSSETPSTSSFEVKINGITQPVKKVVVGSNKVSLTMQTNVFKGDNVFVSYVKPSDKFLQSSEGGIVAAFTDKPVVNNVTEEGSVTIYPNPATDYINISNLEPTAETMIVRIFTLAGKICLEEYLDFSSINTIHFKLKSGMYVVQIVMGSAVKNVQKLIVR